MNADDVEYQGNKGISTNLYTYCLNNPVNDCDTGGNLPAEIVGTVFSALVAHVCDWAEWKLGMRRWSWTQVVAVCAVNAAMGAFHWAIYGGTIVRIKKYAGLLQKYHASGATVKIIK